MRRAIFGIGALLSLCVFAPESQAFFFHHHHLHHYRHGYYGAYGQPAQPLGVQLPGGFGLNIDMQNLAQMLGLHLGGGNNAGGGDAKPPQPTPIKIDPAVKTKVNNIVTEVNDGIGELNALTKRINEAKAKRKYYPDNLKEKGFPDLERITIDTTPSAGGGGTSGASGGAQNPGGTSGGPGGKN